MIADNGTKGFHGRTIAVFAVVLPLLFSCSGKNRQVGEAVTNRDSTAVMVTTGITSLVSENGVIKYRMVTDRWEMFDKTDPPYWAFENKVYLEVLDSTMNVSSLIQADTAYYYSDSKVWELRSNVHAENVDKEKFDTDLLFWNQNIEKVYSDSRITIQQEKQIIRGIGFESNQDFTRYTIRHTDGIFPAERDSL